jgi:hypothetical protein
MTSGSHSGYPRYCADALLAVDGLLAGGALPTAAPYEAAAAVAASC